MARKWKQGKYQLKYPEYYIGENPHDITFRSGWEKKAFQHCEILSKSGMIKGWNSEESVFEYMLPDEEDPTQFKSHRYFMDLTIQLNNGDIVYVEIKPKKEVYRPVRGRNTRSEIFEQQEATYRKNQAKWDAVRNFCERMNRVVGGPRHKFVIWTEDNLLPKR